MNFILIAEVGTEWNFCRIYIIRYEVILRVKLLWLIKRQLEIADINFQRIYEDNRSLPNGADRKAIFKICKIESITYKISWGIQKWTLF